MMINVGRSTGEPVASRGRGVLRPWRRNCSCLPRGRRRRADRRRTDSVSNLPRPALVPLKAQAIRQNARRDQPLPISPRLSSRSSATSAPPAGTSRPGCSRWPRRGRPADAGSRRWPSSSASSHAPTPALTPIEQEGVPERVRSRRSSAPSPGPTPWRAARSWSSASCCRPRPRTTCRPATPGCRSRGRPPTPSGTDVRIVVGVFCATGRGRRAAARPRARGRSRPRDRARSWRPGCRQPSRRRSTTD